MAPGMACLARLAAIRRESPGRSIPRIYLWVLRSDGVTGAPPRCARSPSLSVHLGSAIDPFSSQLTVRLVMEITGRRVRGEGAAVDPHAVTCGFSAVRKDVEGARTAGGGAVGSVVLAQPVVDDDRVNQWKGARRWSPQWTRKGTRRGTNGSAGEGSSPPREPEGLPAENRKALVELLPSIASFPSSCCKVDEGARHPSFGNSRASRLLASPPLDPTLTPETAYRLLTAAHFRETPATDQVPRQTCLYRLGCYCT